MTDHVEQLEVHWPSGNVDVFPNLPIDKAYQIREGDGKPRELNGFGSR
jgi:hypothetical protein